MNHDEKAEFFKILTAMAELYDRELSEASVDLYWRSLRHLDYDTFRGACASCVEKCKFMPKPADIIERAGGGNSEAHAIREWDAVQKAVSDVGAYRSVEFADPVTAKAVLSCGGWSGMCRPDEDEVWLRKRFIETWVSYDHVRTEVEREQIGHLRGIHELEGGVSERALIGQYAGTRKLIAGTKAALQTYQDRK